MKLTVKHSIRGRVRIHLPYSFLSIEHAELFYTYLCSLKEITKAKVYERTADAVIWYEGDRDVLLRRIAAFSFAKPHPEIEVSDSTGRALNHEFQEKLVFHVMKRGMVKFLFPTPLRMVYTLFRSFHYIREGLRLLFKRRLEVPVLDAAAIGVSMFRGDFATAGSVMFLLKLGELLEEWTHKKSVDDLARSMSLQVEKVWLSRDGEDVLVPLSQVSTGDLITVHMGNMIPLDGVVVKGEAMVNQASLTGESIPVPKEAGGYVYAGTVVEEGEITLSVKESQGSTRYEKIVSMIEDSEKLKSNLESRASHLADRLVPFSFLGTVVTYALTRNVARAISILMVDFSCALKLSMPIAVLSAMRECSSRSITVKGGKYLEAVAEADTIVFDKTGTLTKAQPVVAEVVTFGGTDRDEMLRLAACLEEHFPHSMANAVVKKAQEEDLRHDEMHTKVEYIVAHGISSSVDGEKVIIGSYHFVFEDEGCVIPEGEEEKFENLSPEYSHLYLAVSGKLAAVVCIHDTLRPEAAATIRLLRECGIRHIVMMTGDSRRTAEAVAKKVGIDECYAEVLPEDKAAFVEMQKKKGRKVIMVGDGINDSPALSASDAGIAISEGAQIAREIADITISAENLYAFAELKMISNALMKRIHKNYQFVVGFNFALIVMGAMGMIAPATSALLHNTSTIAVSLKCMTNLVPEEEFEAMKEKA